MKYVLASLVAVGLIGGSQVVTYGQEHDCCWKTKDQDAQVTGKVDTSGEKTIRRQFIKPTITEGGKQQPRAAATAADDKKERHSRP